MHFHLCTSLRSQHLPLSHSLQLSQKGKQILKISISYISCCSVFWNLAWIADWRTSRKLKYSPSSTEGWFCCKPNSFAFKLNGRHYNFSVFYPSGLKSQYNLYRQLAIRLCIHYFIHLSEQSLCLFFNFNNQLLDYSLRQFHSVIKIQFWRV